MCFQLAINRRRQLWKLLVQDGTSVWVHRLHRAPAGVSHVAHDDRISTWNCLGLFKSCGGKVLFSSVRKRAWEVAVATCPGQEDILVISWCFFLFPINLRLEIGIKNNKKIHIDLLK